MGQLSAVLRSVVNGHGHWCPGCEEMHVIPNSWTFDGNVDCPTFTPSVKITGKQVVIVDGKWNGEWVRDAAGNPVDCCCHYFVTKGRLLFCSDSTHALSGKTVDLLPLPEHATD